MEKLLCFLEEHHEAFSLDPNEHRENDLLTMEIDVGNTTVKKHAVHRMPFAVRSEVVRQLLNHAASRSYEPLQQPLGEPCCHG